MNTMKYQGKKNNSPRYVTSDNVLQISISVILTKHFGGGGELVKSMKSGIIQQNDLGLL